MHLFQVRIAKLVNNETDLEMEQGADLHSAAVPVDMSPSFKRWKAGGLGFGFLYFKETLFPWDKPETCHCKQSRVLVPEMIHHLSILPCYPEPRSCDFCESAAEVTVAEGRVTRGAGRAPSQSSLEGSLPALAEAPTLLFCAESASAHHRSHTALTWPQLL